ncbi:MAG: hypothetical protein ACNS62_23615 [Candidatus Cyclobacteriaceae bacterium M3_2C_046]
MKNSLLEYQKMIIKKVSFDQQLTGKEYQKALRMLPEKEVSLFKRWFENEFKAEELKQ